MEQSLTARIFEALPNDFSKITPKHIKSIQKMFKLENHEFPIKDVKFAMHRYKHYI
jgi:hypothetical protein